MEITFFEECAPLTEEQWERIIQYFRLKGNPHAVRVLDVARQFQEGMKEIQRSAGHTQEDIDEIGRAVLDMAPEKGGAQIYGE